MQVELLINVLQNLVPDLPSYLLHLILVDLQRQPQWMDIALPKGELASPQCLLCVGIRCLNGILTFV